MDCKHSRVPGDFRHSDSEHSDQRFGVCIDPEVTPAGISDPAIGSFIYVGFGVGVWGFGVWGLRFGVWELWFVVCGLGFGVSKEEGLWFRVEKVRFQGSGFRVYLVAVDGL